MDPKATLVRWLEAGSHEEAEEAARDYNGWVRGGGFEAEVTVGDSLEWRKVESLTGSFARLTGTPLLAGFPPVVARGDAAATDGPEGFAF